MNMTHYIVENGMPIFLGVLVGAIFCFILMSLFSPKRKRHQCLAKELAATKAELERQRNDVVKHFSDSAELLDKMAQDFRHLYQHMATNSTSILNGETPKTAPQLESAQETKITTDAEVEITDLSAVNVSDVKKEDLSDTSTIKEIKR